MPADRDDIPDAATELDVSWAAEDEVARMHGASYLRLDCDASRRKLCALYSSLGFRHRSDLEVNTFRVRRFERAVS
jgi:hypothetical protein